MRGSRSKTRMERARLEELSLEDLQEEATRYRLTVSERRDHMIDILMTHFEWNAPSQDFFQGQETSNRPEPRRETGLEADRAAGPTTRGPAPQPDFSMMFGQMMFQMQQLIDSKNRNAAQGTPHQRAQEDFGSHRNSPSTSMHTTVSAASPANVVSLLALQIPEFTGEASDNVRRWIQRVDQVARTHRASDEVTMLAASSKLMKTARKWYDSQSGAVLESWANLSQCLKKMFHRRAPFLVTMQKVEARKWIQSKEQFQEYAIDKMSMLYGLELSGPDTIIVNRRDSKSGAAGDGSHNSGRNSGELHR